MQTRWSAYAGVSVALAGGVVVKAMAQRPNFYSAAVYLSQSSANLMILTNMVFVIACSLLLGLQKVLYGPLRPIEIEQLYEKAWFAVTETCLAMTIFRGEIGAWFLVMFFALLAGKVWAWIGEGRVDILEQQPPRDPRLFHTRLALSLGLSVAFDLTMLEFVVTEVMHMPKPDMMVMFGFEFAVLSIVSLSTAARYAISLVEIAIVRNQKVKAIDDLKRERREAAIRVVLDRVLAEQANTTGDNAAEPPAADTPNPAASLPTDAMNAARAADQQPVDEAEVEVEGWEGKGRWVFYLDLTTDFLKLVVYLSFFFILLAFYGLPIHILRDVFMTCRSFIKRISDFIKYRNATRDMNERYPDATEQDFRREDVCIICREEMRPYEPPAQGQRPNPVAERMRPKKLPCGHVLHFSCLRSWLERQQICPTCRTSVVPTPQHTNVRNGAGGGQAGAEQQQQQQQQHPAGGDDNRARGGVLRLGPLRIAMGAARGNNMAGDLQQRLRDGDGQGGPPGNNVVQQYGFGIRWDGMRRRERRPHEHRSVQDRLSSVERQIQQEISSLGASMAELQVLRGMEAQLALLRRHRETITNTQQAPRPTGSQPATSGSTVTTQLVGDGTARMQAGHPDLPAGLNLPEGWSLTPLTPTPAPAIGQLPRFPGSNIGVPMGFPPPNVPLTMPGRMMPFGTNFPIPPPQQQPTQPAAGIHHHPPTQASIPTATQIQESRQGPTLHEVPAVNGGPAEVRNLADIMAAIANSNRQPGDNRERHVTNGVAESPPALHNGNSNITVADNHTVNSPHLAQESNAARVETLPTPALPLWGSEANSGGGAASASASTSTSIPIPGNPYGSSSARNETAEDGSERLHSTTAQHNSSQAEVRSSADSSSKRRNPTVEDLVEGPD